MRLCSWTGACCLLPVLVLLTVLDVKASQHRLKERHYYIAAVEINWNYYNDQNSFGPTYRKVVFREYDRDFLQAKTHPSSLGLLGPTLRAEEGETIVVTFRNMANGVYSIHPHGVAYGKQSEGAHYFDNTSLKEKEDDIVRPESEHVYYWEVTPQVSPGPDDPTCLTYTYVSHQNVVQDYNSGLIGALLICKPGSLDELGNQAGIHKEHVFLFGVFDEKDSMYIPNEHASDNHVKYTINGYTKGSLPDISMCAHASVSLHLIGMSSEAELFSVHMNGQVLTHNGHKVSSVGLISGSTATVSLVALHPGRWLLSSHTYKHMEANMHGFVDVNKCEGFKEPVRRLTISQKRQSTEWKYYIAAEEIVWDYSPNMQEHIDKDFKLQYLTQSSTRIGRKYKKAVYTLYTNESFTEKSENKQRKNELGIIGPVIRAQIRDVIKIVFKNMASRPYSIYPHGLSIMKSEEGANYPEGGNQSHAVQPGETHTYVWEVLEEDQPLDSDSRCLTRMYHSAVDTPRDIASGLIGPMLICKSQSLNVRNVQLRADKEQHAIFAVFDENKSWYLDDNTRQYCDRSKVDKADMNFYKSNVMHTINGYSYESGPLLGFCNGEVATWHVSSIGAQDYVQTTTFYGHPFELNERTEDFLSLFPMTGETITMNMDNIGVWLVASLNTHHTTKGMRVKFQDVECYRDYQYEYEYENNIPKNEFTLWKPPTLDDVKKEEEKEKEKEKTKVAESEPDVYTEMFANELGLRSLKNQSKNSDMEKLDLSFLDYDAIDVPDGDVTLNLNVKNTVTKTKSSIKPNTQNETEFSNWNKMDGLNVTFHSNNQENASLHQTMNTSVLSSQHVSLKNGSLTTNASISEAVSGPNNDTVYLTKNATVFNVTGSSDVGNVSADTANFTGAISQKTSNLTVELQEATNQTVGLPEDTTSMSGNETTNTTLPGDSHASVDVTLSDDSVERLTRGDVFFYDVPLYKLSINSLNNPPSSEVSNVALLQSTRSEDENNTTSKQVDVSGAEGNRSVSSAALDLEGFNQSRRERGNMTLFDLAAENTDNRDNNSLNTTAQPEHGLQRNYTDVFTVQANSSLENLKPDAKVLITSDETGALDSNEEVFIYLKENITEVIKTSSFTPQDYNWTYDGTHSMVPEDITENIKKYFNEETLQTTPSPKKFRKVTLRQRPKKGQGMKTRKRKEYKALARSGLPFSPRGFNPGMTPRGSRPQVPQPFSDEDNLINMPVVIGVPRPDFSDYQLYVPGEEPDHPDADDLTQDEYEYVMHKDPYSGLDEVKNLNLDETARYYLKLSGPNVKTYFIAAEEVEWDYGGYGQRRQEKSQLNSRETTFTKVVFRGYLDSSFSTPDIRGELHEHLGILGPVIKAEVGQSIMVVFKNNANRPYSIHPNGITYTKQTEGLSYEDGSKYWYKYDNEVPPNSTFTYLWKVGPSVGPESEECPCRTWAYYSGVNPEKDIHSGLIGPLLVCRQGALNDTATEMREFMLLFMTFDESKSWYYDRNAEFMHRKSHRRILDANHKEKLKFHTINGIIYSLKGLRMYANQLVCWHLINLGAPKDFHSVHFHGQTFLHKATKSHRQAVYPLLPGNFATLEMYPSKPGLWQLETEVGLHQQKGMQTLFLVLHNDCYRPLGLESGSVKDSQIVAINTEGYWLPHLARLNNYGKYNAWSTEKSHSWIQVDFERPVVISQVATQGAKQIFQSQFVENYSISYSNDRRKWLLYKGNSKDYWKVFPGNQEAYETKKNTFFPPVIGRYIRFHPITWNNRATVRMEFYGCELDGCSVPLGMESRLIADEFITASSTASSWFAGPWKPSLARLNRQGTVNAWTAKYNDMRQWLQVELPQVKKITGIITQGAKSLGKEMYVVSYILQYSDNGIHWTRYTDDDDQPVKIFLGNMNNNDHVKNYIYPPIFSRFIRIVPQTWMGAITMRIELLGCDYE
ncbi:coagulation factor V [Xenentodon cancila]